MNFIEAVKLFQLDKNIKLMRRAKDFEFTYGLISINLTITDILAEDWYVVKSEKLHTFEEALKALKKGKIIKRKSSAVEFYHDYTPNTIGSNVPYQPEKYDGDKWVDMSFTNDDILANDWIIIDKEETK